MKNRSELREIIMKVLYQSYILGETKLEYNVDEFIKEQLEVQNDFVSDTVHGVIEHQKHISEVADRYLEESGWKMKRLNKVDQAIISLGIYELLYTETPSVVAINEAIELSKKYSDEKVTGLINGVLDRIYHSEVSDAR